GSLLSDIQFPLVTRNSRDSHLSHSVPEPVRWFLALAAANNFSHLRNEYVHCTNGFRIVIHSHVERFDFRRIVVKNDGLLEYLLREESFVFRLKIQAPTHWILKRLSRFLEQRYGFRVGQSFEISVNNAFQSRTNLFVHPLPEKIHFIRTLLDRVAEEKLQKVFRKVHIVLELGPCHFRLDHPKLRGVPAGVGVFGSERWTEGIDVPKSRCQQLRFELAGNS